MPQTPADTAADAVRAEGAAAQAAAGRALQRVRIHALRPGTWPAAPADLTISAADIERTAAAYDTRRYQAPVVIGHPENDHPAWGWITGATAQADGLWLEAELLPEMAELVRAARYRAVSVSLWTPEAPGNPAPGAWSLKHLGFLGAAPPAVKGLAPVRLDAAEAACSITVTVTPEDRRMNDQDTAHLAERETALAEREAALARREAQLRREGYEREIDAHVAAGRVLAADRGGLVALMERLDAAPAVTLAEAGEQPALAVLRGFLGRLPAQVDLAERAAPQRGIRQAGAAIAAPHGYRLSEAGMTLHQRALEYQAAHPGTDYIGAVRAVENAR